VGIIRGYSIFFERAVDSFMREKESTAPKKLFEQVGEDFLKDKCGQA
jgi:hypothetical protein